MLCGVEFQGNCFWIPQVISGCKLALSPSSHINSFGNLRKSSRDCVVSTWYWWIFAIDFVKRNRFLLCIHRAIY